MEVWGMTVKYGIRAAALATVVVCGLTGCGSESEPLSEKGAEEALLSEKTLPDGWKLRHAPTMEDFAAGENRCRNWSDTKCPGFVATGSTGLEGVDVQASGHGSIAGVTIHAFDTAGNAEAAFKGMTPTHKQRTGLEVRTGADQTTASHSVLVPFPWKHYSSYVDMRVGSTIITVAAQVKQPKDVTDLARYTADHIRKKQSGG
ncbi:hypothetical protein ACIF6H_35690 [Streptomyces microflavus]|uniref:hypothetical protein n=1 Tax=Streptomyces microflavus TaxID=1919 RepID=UPI002E130B52|nr:hypothetical protein OG728_00770 [Streptomyces microflavus]